MNQKVDKTFCLSQFITGHRHRLLKKIFVNTFNRLLLFDLANEVFSQQNEAATAEDFLDGVLGHLNLSQEYDTREFGYIPETGPAVVIANHPSGLSETMLLTQLLLKKRTDIRVLATVLLDSAPLEFESIMIGVDNISKTPFNKKSVEEAMAWVKSGGLLLIFPAGEISDIKFQPKHTGLYDSEWSRLPVSIAEKTETPIIPVYISARNSWLFYFLRMVNRYLGLTLIFRELFRHRGKSIKFRVGMPVRGRDLAHLRSSREKIDYLYYLTYSLRHRPLYQAQKKQKNEQKTDKPGFMIEALPHYHKIQSEVDQLVLADKLLLEIKSYQVFLLDPSDPYELLRRAVYIERERAFRAIGMGSNKLLDTDRYDAINYQLIVWDKEHKCVVGGYRFSITDFNDQDARNKLSLSTLYHILPKKTNYKGQFMEMGRSFVQVDYQNQYWPLLILWRGLGTAILKFKSIGFVTGLVSIPVDYYSTEDLDLLSVYVKEKSKCYEKHAQHFVPHFPYKQSCRLPNELTQAIRVSPTLTSCEFMLKQLLEKPVAFPPLLRHYEAVGAHPLHMSKDPFFGNCVDIMMFWEIENTVFAKLKPYIGKKGIEELSKRFIEK